MSHILKDLPPLVPSTFFQIKAKIYQSMKSKALLPDTSTLLGEEHFVDMALSWSLEGIKVSAKAHKDLVKGDCLELFFDTRDVKSANSITRFCHHFLIYPEKIDGVQAVEVTRFRNDDGHKLADPSLFSVLTTVRYSFYKMDIKICKDALHGYNPTECKRLGFYYRFIRKNGPPQHFAVSSVEFSIDKHPELWPSLELAKE